jgi:ABC-2 type transport system permease protein
MKILAIAGTSVRRLLRDRTNALFVFVLPILLILIIGAVFGSSFTPRIGLVAPAGDSAAAELESELRADGSIRIATYDDAAALEREVVRGNVDAGLVIPDGYGASLAGGGTVDLTYFARQDGSGFDIQSLVEAVVADQSARIQAARFTAAETATGYDQAYDLAGSLAGSAQTVEVEVVGADALPSVGQFDLGAAQELVLFMFITSLAGSAALVLSRKLGVSRRMYSTPTTAPTIITGETLGRFLVAMVQGVFIVVVAALLFGVQWGDPVAAGLLVTVTALVGTGAAMLVGATFSNEEQAGGIGVFLGLGLGALGGCMVPLEIFSPTMTRVAHITPHAWALDGFSDLIRHEGGVGDILPEVGVLLAFAAALLAVASWRFARVLTR